MNNLDTSSFEEKVRLATQTPEPGSEFADGLWAQIAQRSFPQSARNTSFPRFFPRPVWAIVIILAIALVSCLIIGPQRVIAAVQSLFGYISQIGFIDNPEEALALPKPVFQTQNGVTLTVDQAVADTHKTIIVYHVEGLPSDAKSTSNDQGNRQPAVLRLSDGSILTMTYTNQDISAGRYEFPPLPKNIQTMTFELPSLPLVRPGIAPENWQIPLKLELANTIQQIGAAYDPQISSPTRDDVFIKLERVAYKADKTILQVGIYWQNQNWSPVSPGTLILKDAAGNVIQMVPGDDALGQTIQTGDASVQIAQSVVTEPTGSSTPVAELHESQLYAFPPLDPSQTYTLSLEKALFQYMNLDQAAFQFDIGKDVTVGQSWAVNETVVVNGYPIHFIAARCVDGNNVGKIGLQFDIEAPTGVQAVFLEDSSPNLRGGTSSSASMGLPLQSTLYYDPVPDGPINIKVSGMSIDLTGPWELQWKP
jgi:hypothetical protein